MFSVIIPTYNRNNFVINAIRSATSKLTEVIVIDTNVKHSIDFELRVRDVCPGVVYRYYGRANGSVARNYGASISSFNWLLFLDDDDEFTSEKVFVLRNHILKYGFQKFYVSNSLIRNSFYTRTFRLGSSSYLTIFEHIIDDNKFNSSSFAVEKNAFWKIGGFDENLVRKQDFDFLYRALRLYDVMVIPDFLQILDKSDRSNIPSFVPFIRNQVGLFNKYYMMKYPSFYHWILLISEFLISLIFLAVRKRDIIGIVISIILNTIFFLNIPLLLFIMYRKLKRYFHFLKAEPIVV